MAKVSVIIPVHNMQELLGKCMESVMSQTMSDLEMILVENASTDDSPVMCDEYALKDQRVKVLHLDVGDLSTARNSGVAVATSEYVAFLDSDDTVDPQMYDTLYSFAVENDLDLVYCNHVQIFDDRPPKYKFPETGTRTVIKFYCAVNMIDTYDKCSIAHLEEKTFSDVAVSSKGDYVHLKVKSLNASGFDREIIDFYNESLGIGNPKVCPY